MSLHVETLKITDLYKILRLLLWSVCDKMLSVNLRKSITAYVYFKSIIIRSVGVTCIRINM